VFIVEWDDHTGARRQQAFDDLEDARLEAQYLKLLYDFVQIREGGER